MIGPLSVLMELLFLIIPIIFLIVGVVSLPIEKSFRAFVWSLLVFVIFITAAFRFFHQVRNHIVLNSLNPNAVASIQIGDYDLSSKDQLEIVTSALSKNRWFTSNHGGWAEKVPLVIKCQDGKISTYRVGYYLKREGGIEFFREEGKIRWADGYAFGPDFPAALQPIQVDLPAQPVAP